MILPFSIFTVISVGEEYRGIEWMGVPINIQYVIFAILVFALLVIFTKAIRGIKIDKITTALIARDAAVLLSFINYESTIIEFIYSGYFSMVFGSVVYIVAINSYREGIEKFIHKVFIVMFIAVAFQVVITLVVSIAEGVSSSTLKTRMVIPLGASNSIAMGLSMLGIYVLLQIKNGSVRKILTVAAVVIISLTLSSGAMISLVIVITLYYFDKVRNNYLKVVLVISAILLGIIMIAMPTERSEIMRDDENLFESYRYTTGQLRARQYYMASHGRFDIYRIYLMKVVDKPIVGHGYYKHVSKMGINAHNFIISELYTGGIATCGILIYILVTIFRTLRRYIGKDNVIRGVYYSCIYLVVHSFIEPGLLGYQKGFLFWIIVAIGMGRIRHLLVSSTKNDVEPTHQVESGSRASIPVEP